MPHPFSHYHLQLMNQILHASSQDEVQQQIDEVLKAIATEEEDALVSFYFVGKIITELEQYSPMKKNADQWSNIQNARVYLHRIRNGMIQTSKHE